MVSFCTSGSVVMKAGTNAPSMTEAQYTELISGAMAFVCTAARYDYQTNYSSLNESGRELLRDITSSKAAIAVIQKNMSGYTSLSEAQTMLDVNYAIVTEGINMLLDDKYRTFIKP